MIAIIDYGSQYTQLIARKVRELEVRSEIFPPETTGEALAALKPAGVILSGGPASVYAPGAPQLSEGLLGVGVPILGICYGMQLIGQATGAVVARSQAREYGAATIRTRARSAAGLFEGLPVRQSVWMSHGDKVAEPPPGFRVLASSENCPVAAMADPVRALYALQFHPEVAHSEHGLSVLRNFVFGICRARRDWKMGSFIEETTERLRESVRGRSLVCAVSGGVDSTVMAVLLHRALGRKLQCTFVDNGLLRTDEARHVAAMFKSLGIRVRVIDAADRFLSDLRGVTDPEEKRRRIGRAFIDVFFPSLGEGDLLAQGTLYPDVIESVSTKGPSATIKTHHNRVPEVLRLMEEGRIVEPLRELFKDEVRAVGKRLGIPKEVLRRHPFPGPGLAVRCLGEVTRERLSVLRKADDILLEELRASKWYDKTWQALAVLLPVRSVGVMGDERTYDQVCAIRCVTSTDGMTADWVRLPHDVLARIGSRIVNEVKGINRVVYDISTKPPSTIEWE